jgi:hypothetical protein
MTEPFTLEGYEALIAALLARGYHIRSFADAQPGERHLILRHDVDQSLEAAVRLARREAAAGWAATYFVLLRSEMYNPFSPASVQALAELRQLGHAVGLHLDGALYDGELEALEVAAHRECTVLEAILKAPVDMISFHRPAPGLVPCDRVLAGRRNTYESRFIDEIGYCSDSRGGWHRGHPLKNPAVVEGRALQLLTHAIWWDGVEIESPREKLDQVVKTRDQAVRDELAANNAVYRKADEP